MKKVTLSFLAFAASFMMASAQAPAKFNYQGIARNASGAPLASQALGMRITIRDAATAGAVLYQETQTATTNTYGLYNVIIGSGTPVSGTMSGVNWASGDKYIQVEIDVNGGTAYADLGTTQLLSVPYAMHSGSTTAPTLTLTGNTLSAGGNSVTLPGAPTYSAGTGISISGSNVISANNLSGDVTGAPNANTVTKLQGTSVSSSTPSSGQVLKYSGSTWTPGTDNDAQTLSVSGSTLSISGGNSITLPAGTSYSAGTGLTLSSGTFSANSTSAIWNANQLQSTSVSATAPTSGQALKYNGTAWAPAADNDAQTLSISGSTLSISGGNSVTIPSSSLSGTTNYVTKFTSASAVGNSQIFDDGTSVGIGTASPGSGNKLMVVNSSTSSSNFAIKATSGSAPSSGITTPAAIYGESNSGIGLVGISGSQNGVYGLSATGVAGVVGIHSGSGYGVAGAVNGAGIAGYFDAGTTGAYGLQVVGNAPSTIGAPSSSYYNRLAVIQPGSSTLNVDTAAPIYAYAGTQKAAQKGAVYGTYNSSYYGAGVSGIGFNGLMLQHLPSLSGVLTNGTTDIGVYGSANSAGVFGHSTYGYGVQGYSTNSYAMYGYSTNSVGVYGSSPSSSGTGVTGVGNSYGVYGNGASVSSSTSANRTGVYGNASGGTSFNYGVYGLASGSTGSNYAVYGQAASATSNYAGYFYGNVGVSGSISKGSGTFKIDHPLDPEHKYLYHSFVESPDMMNIYNGNIVTDGNGIATVTMPSYFDALNKDFRYQLTVIGTFAQAIVKEEMSGNSFIIQTNQPNVKVSWQVTGVRNDKYAQAHRVQAEVAKEPENQGRYLHAPEWGKPENMSIGYGQNPVPQTKEPSASTRNNLR